MTAPRLADLAPERLRAALDALDALADLPEAEQAARLHQLAQTDAELAQVVAQLRLPMQPQAGAAPGADWSAALERPAPFAGRPNAGAPAEAAPLPERIGPYRVLSVLGSGGMSHVYAALRADGNGQRVVALKVLRPELVSPALRERFAREQALQERLTHAHIAQLYDAGLDAQGHPYLAMERIDGQAITAYAQAHALGVEDRLRLVLQAAAAVSHAHARLIVHRDLKPNNILVDAEGRVKLLDFGIAKWLEGEAAGEATELTRAAGRAFTPDYAAPEQVLGERITVATDVHALGVLLYELLTGQRPIDRWVAQGLPPLLALTQHDAPRASGAVTDRARARALRGDLDAVIAHALARQPEDRYPSVAALAEDLQRVLDHRPVQARSAPWADRAAKFVRRNPIAVGLSAALVLAGAIGVGATLWQAERARAEAARADAVRDFLVGLFRSATPEVSQDAPPSARDLAREGEQRLGDDARLPDNARAELQGVLAEVWARSGEPQRSVALLRQRIDLLTGLHGADSEEVAQARYALGEALMYSDLPAEAEAVWRAALPAAQAHARAGGTAWVQIRLGLSWLRGLTGDTEGDLADRLELLAEVQDLPHPDAKVIADVYNDLGSSYFMDGQYAQAQQAFEQTIAYDRTHADGPGARDVREQLNARSNLVFTHWALGDLRGAREESRQLLAEVAKRLGENHVLALNQARLGVMLATELGDYPAALDIIDRTLPRVDRSKPEWGKWEVALLSDRALVWAHTARAREGAQLARAQLDHFLAEPRPEPYGADIASLARLDALLAQGRHQDAEREAQALWTAFNGQWRPVRQAQLRLRQVLATWADPVRTAARLDDARRFIEHLPPRDTSHGRLCALDAAQAARTQTAAAPDWNRCLLGLGALPDTHPAVQALHRLRLAQAAGAPIRTVPVALLY